MSLLFTQIQDAVYNAILGAGENTRVIFFYPNAPRPQLPYTSIQTLSIGAVIDDWDEFNDIDNESNVYGMREIIFSVNAYGINADSEILRLQGKLQTQSVREVLRDKIGISIMSVGAPRDLSTLIDSGYEKRFSMDIVFNVNVEDGSTIDDTGYFDTVSEIVWTNQP